VSPAAAYAGAVLVGAGSGRRMGGRRKAFLELAGRPLIERAAGRLAAAPEVGPVVLVLHADDLERGRALVGRCGIVAAVPGGERRSDSVLAGLAALPACEVVLIHDAARPLVDPAVVSRVACVARHAGAALAACPVSDTLKRAGGTAVRETVDRQGMWAAQTPQGFRREIYEELARRAAAEGLELTDDAAVLEHYGRTVELVPSTAGNLKITTPEDLALAGALLGAGGDAMRAGSGYDVHLLEPGRKLVLGGVEVPAEAGAVAHSDGDVLCHAVMDALLGAAALGDIGTHFPDSDGRWRGARSLELLRQVGGQLAAAGFRPVNVDATVMLERPRLGALKAAMAANLAAALGLATSAVSVKAGTNEGLGDIGAGRAVACLATAAVETPRRAD
jgi:2-C-methyl-D-erythritol 4-phosphate cytidylyltransferase/2-C-methyl-D-erythritol 2,4-cyclodiphosphate synthase